MTIVLVLCVLVLIVLVVLGLHVYNSLYNVTQTINISDIEGCVDMTTTVVYDGDVVVIWKDTVFSDDVKDFAIERKYEGMSLIRNYKSSRSYF